MSAWQKGARDVQALIDDGKLTRLQGADAGVEGLMGRARQLLDSAAELLSSDPATSYIVAYDAAKHAAMAVLAMQNLRGTPAGGHVVIEKALVAQFPGVFDNIRQLRRRRHELDYPTGPNDFADATEATRALDSATRIVDNAEKVLDQGVLGHF